MLILLGQRSTSATGMLRQSRGAPPTGFSTRHGLLGCEAVIWGKEAIRYLASSPSTVSRST